MTEQRPLTIALVAGETSGDILGAGLIRALKERVPNARFVGVAGPRMQAEGCEAWYEMEELAVMGIVEVLGRLRRLLHIRADLTKRFGELKPDVFVGIDAPDFNITLEGNLKKQGIKTIHYVSPSVWAWRQKRVFKIGRATDLVLAFLPFEKAFYDKYNVPCRFIGHTMADAMPLDPDKNGARDVLGIPYDAHCLALLPGSRGAEVEMLSADFLKTAQLLRQTYPDLEIVVPLVNAKRREQFERIKAAVAPDLSVHLLDGMGREAMVASDAALLASGTAALECMLAKCPMVVGYRMKPFTFWLAKRLVKTDYVSLPNLLAGRELVKELLQEECEPQKLAAALLPLLANGKTSHAMHDTFRELHQQIRCNADEQGGTSRSGVSTMIEFVYPHTQLVAGVDEVGRGPLVGAVVTAAVILDPARPIAGLNDSKKLSEKRRLALCEEIKEKALSWSLGRAEPHEIDELNILHATMLAMQRAVAGLHIAPEYVLIDGNRCPKLPMPSMAVVKGDSRVPEISAASILAKVTRDAEMAALDIVFPQYGFAQHKGYPTAFHLEKLAEHGATEHHRRSFGPVKRALGLAS